MDYKVDIYLDSRNERRWTVASTSNGRTIGASSEGFDTKQNCINNFALLARVMVSKLK